VRTIWEAHHLALERSRVADAGSWIVRQKQLLDELEACGRSTEDAEKTLALMVTLLGCMQETEATIRWLLSRSSIH
jgi:hypothetical protein